MPPDPDPALSHDNRMAYAGELLREVAHDLKSPLTAIIGVLEVITASGARLSEAQRDTLLRTALIESYRLEHFIQNISLFNRLQLHTTPLEKTNVSLGNMLHTLRDKMSHRHPHITWADHTDSDEIMVIVEPRWFGEALWQLLDNVGRHNKSPTQLEINLETTYGALVLSISDKGAGIPGNIADKIFDAYSKGPQTQKDHICAGVGLTLARDIMRRHGGDVVLEGEPVSSGQIPAVFTVTIPVV